VILLSVTKNKVLVGVVYAKRRLKNNDDDVTGGPKGLLGLHPCGDNDNPLIW
jgi:hypothetical protein